jgi:hypothetical protein
MLMHLDLSASYLEMTLHKPLPGSGHEHRPWVYPSPLTLIENITGGTDIRPGAITDLERLFGHVDKNGHNPSRKMTHSGAYPDTSTTI